MLRVVGTAQHVHDLLGVLAAAGVGVDVELLMPGLVVPIGFGSRELYATERAALDVRLHLQNPLYELRVRGTEADTPAGHVVTLRHGVQFYTTLLGTGHLKDAHRPLSVEDEAVGVVVDDDQSMLQGKLHQLLVGFHTGGSSGGHVGIVDPKEAARL